MAARSGGQIDTVMHETRVFPPPAEFAAKARIKSLDEYQTAVGPRGRRSARVLGRAGPRRAALVHAVHQGARVERAVRPVVRRRQDERLVQLPRPQSGGRAGRPHGDPLGRRAGRQPHAHLCRAAPRRVQVCQRAQEARHQAGRPSCRSTCRWCRSWRSPCWPVRGSGRSTR